MRRLQTYWNKERMEAFLYPHRDLRKLLLAHMWHGSEVQKDVGAGRTKRYIYIWGIPRGTSDCLMGRRKSIWIITGIAFLPHLGGNLVHIRHFKMGFTSGNQVECRWCEFDRFVGSNQFGQQIRNPHKLSKFYYSRISLRRRSVLKLLIFSIIFYPNQSCNYWNIIIQCD